jgi:hypothetical protein
VKLDTTQVAALDEMTTPSHVYPSWFIENLKDQTTRVALSVVDEQSRTSAARGFFGAPV